MIPRNPTEQACFFLVRHLRFLTVAAGVLFLFSTVLLLSGRRSAETLFREAMESAARGETAAALAALDELEADYPDWSRLDEALYRQGSLQRTSGDLRGALDSWKALAARFPKSAWAEPAMDGAATLLYDGIGDRAAAVAIWKGLLNQNPDSPEADRYRIRLSAYLLQTDRPDAELLELKPFLDGVKDPHLKARVAVDLATLYFNRGEEAAAECTLRQVVDAPHCPDCKNRALMLLADLLEGAGRLDEAEQAVLELGAEAMPESDKRRRLTRIQAKAAAVPKPQ